MEVKPAVLLPRKDDAVADPMQRIVGVGAAENRALAFVRAPQLAALAGGRVGDADRPRRPAPLRREDEELLARRDADERDVLRVGRPDRRGVAVDARIEIADLLRGDVDDADERVLRARRDEGDLRPRRATSADCLACRWRR